MHAQTAPAYSSTRQAAVPPAARSSAGAHHPARPFSSATGTAHRPPRQRRSTQRLCVRASAAEGTSSSLAAPIPTRCAVPLPRSTLAVLVPAMSTSACTHHALCSASEHVTNGRLPSSHRPPILCCPTRMLRLGGIHTQQQRSPQHTPCRAMPCHVCRLNTIPHERSTRQYFYRDTVSGVLSAVAAGETRMVARWGGLLPDSAATQDRHTCSTQHHPSGVGACLAGGME